MTDRYIAFANSPSAAAWLAPSAFPPAAPGALAGRPGAPGGRPAGDRRERRAGRGRAALRRQADRRGVRRRRGQFELPRWTAEHSPRAKAVLFDASGLTRFEQLVALRDFFQPVLKGLDTCPKVVVLGRPRVSRTR